MYDAKLKSENEIGKENNLKSECICDRSYYSSINNINIIKKKSSYVPIENLIK